MEGKMESTTNVPQQQPAAQAPAEKPARRSEEFSFAWHMKVLAVIYVILGILYLVLKLTLK
jgi:hypothetical protein